MTWNYRVVRHVDPHDKVTYTIREVFYEEGRIVTVTEEAAYPSGESAEELHEDLERMKEALEKPVLDYSKCGVEQME